MSIQAIQLPAKSQGTVFFQVSNDGAPQDADVYWNMQSDAFSCEYDANGSNPVIWQGLPPTLPAWVGLRQSGGAVYCEIYENGSWKTYGSIGGTMDTTRADVTFGAYVAGGASPGSYTAVLDSYNLAPP